MHLGKRDRVSFMNDSSEDQPKQEDQNAAAVCLIQEEITKSSLNPQLSDFTAFLKELLLALHIGRTLSTSEDKQNTAGQLLTIASNCLETVQSNDPVIKKKCTNFVVKHRLEMEEYLIKTANVTAISLQLAENYMQNIVAEICSDSAKPVSNNI